MTWGDEPEGRGCVVPLVLAAAAIVVGLLGLAILVALGVDQALDGWSWDGWTP